MGLEIKGIVLNPQACNVELMAPYWIFRRKIQTNAVTTTGTMAGKKKTARKNERSTMRELSNNAIRNADNTPRGELNRTHHRVLPATSLKSASSANAT